MKLLQSLIILIGTVAGNNLTDDINSGMDIRDFKVSNLKKKRVDSC